MVGTKVGGHAVVVGAGMAGLLAARVLADCYERVTIVERDVLAAEPANRRGVPQGRHVHVLLGRGSQIIDELFPGILEELVADGAPVWTDGDLSKLYISVGGHHLTRIGTLRDPHGLTMYMASRPFLECHVRRRLRARVDVTVLDGHEVAELVSTPDRRAVTGVRIVERAGGDERCLTADLVLDATGRGSRTPAFLADMGYGHPPEDEVMVRVAYASQLLRIPAGAFAERLVVIGAAGDRVSSVGLVGYENDSWMLTVSGYMGHRPPLDRDAMLRFAEESIPSHLLPALRAATPLGEVFGYRVPSNRWRRYDKMARLPDGLLVSGDGICSFNPVYGQGMTIAALDALALRRCLRRGIEGLPRRFFHASAKGIGVAWQAATASDLSLPRVPGRRTLSIRATHAYLERVLTAAEPQPPVCEAFLRTMQLVDPPTRLLAPGVLGRAAVARRGRSAGSPITEATPDRVPVGHGEQRRMS
ncbi:FAD-dependent oxidoreductase [Mycolicibacterium thermoresistibile]